MLNNLFDKKNVILSLGLNDKIPYNHDNKVNVKANAIIFATLNNIFKALLANDLYLEQLTYNIKNNINVPGAMVTNSEALVYDSQDGQKFALTSNQEPYVQIVRKKIADIDATISCIPELSTSYIHFIFSDSTKYYAGTSKGLYCSYDREGPWERVTDDDTFKSSFGNYDCRCLIENTHIGKFVNENGIEGPLNNYSYFLGTNRGVFGLNTGGMTGDNYWEKIAKTSMINTVVVNDLCIDKNRNRLIVSTPDGIYWTDGKIVEKYNGLVDAQVNDAMMLDNDSLIRTGQDILIATDQGVKQSKFGYFPVNLQLKHQFEDQIKFVQTDGTHVFVCLKTVDDSGHEISNSVYVFENDNFDPKDPIYETETDFITDFKYDPDSKTLMFSNGTNKFYSISSPFELLGEELNVEKIDLFCRRENHLVVCEGNKIDMFIYTGKKFVKDCMLDLKVALDKDEDLNVRDIAFDGFHIIICADEGVIICNYDLDPDKESAIRLDQTSDLYGCNVKLLIENGLKAYSIAESDGVSRLYESNRETCNFNEIEGFENINNIFFDNYNKTYAVLKDSIKGIDINFEINFDVDLSVDLTAAAFEENDNSKKLFIASNTGISALSENELIEIYNDQTASITDLKFIDDSLIAYSNTSFIIFKNHEIADLIVETTSNELIKRDVQIKEFKKYQNTDNEDSIILYEYVTENDKTNFYGRLDNRDKTLIIENGIAHVVTYAPNNDVYGGNKQFIYVATDQGLSTAEFPSFESIFENNTSDVVGYETENTTPISVESTQLTDTVNAFDDIVLASRDKGYTFIGTNGGLYYNKLKSNYVGLNSQLPTVNFYQYGNPVSTLFLTKQGIYPFDESTIAVDLQSNTFIDLKYYNVSEIIQKNGTYYAIVKNHEETMLLKHVSADTNNDFVDSSELSTDPPVLSDLTDISATELSVDLGTIISNLISNYFISGTISAVTANLSVFEHNNSLISSYVNLYEKSGGNNLNYQPLDNFITYVYDKMSCLNLVGCKTPTALFDKVSGDNILFMNFIGGVYLSAFSTHKQSKWIPDTEYSNINCIALSSNKDLLPVEFNLIDDGYKTHKLNTDVTGLTGTDYDLNNYIFNQSLPVPDDFPYQYDFKNISNVINIDSNQWRHSETTSNNIKTISCKLDLNDDEISAINENYSNILDISSDLALLPNNGETFSDISTTVSINIQLKYENDTIETYKISAIFKPDWPNPTANVNYEVLTPSDKFNFKSFSVYCQNTRSSISLKYQYEFKYEQKLKSIEYIVKIDNTENKNFNLLFTNISYSYITQNGEKTYSDLLAIRFDQSQSEIDFIKDFKEYSKNYLDPNIWEESNVFNVFAFINEDHKVSYTINNDSFDTNVVDFNELTNQSVIHMYDDSNISSETNTVIVATNGIYEIDEFNQTGLTPLYQSVETIVDSYKLDSRYLFVTETGQFYKFENLSVENPIELSSVQSESFDNARIFIDKNNNVYVSSNKRVYQIDLENMTSSIKDDIDNSNMICYGIFQDENNNIFYAASKTSGNIKYDDIYGRVICYDNFISKINGISNVKKLQSLNSSDILFTTNNQEFEFILDNLTIKVVSIDFENYECSDSPIALLTGVTDFSIRDVYSDKFDIYVITTDNKLKVKRNVQKSDLTNSWDFSDPNVEISLTGNYNLTNKLDDYQYIISGDNFYIVNSVKKYIEVDELNQIESVSKNSIDQSLYYVQVNTLKKFNDETVNINIGSKKKILDVNSSSAILENKSGKSVPVEMNLETRVQTDIEDLNGINLNTALNSDNYDLKWFGNDDGLYRNMGQPYIITLNTDMSILSTNTCPINANQVDILNDNFYFSYLSGVSINIDGTMTPVLNDQLFQDYFLSSNNENFGLRESYNKIIQIGNFDTDTLFFTDGENLSVYNDKTNGNYLIMMDELQDLVKNTAIVPFCTNSGTAYFGSDNNLLKFDSYAIKQYFTACEDIYRILQKKFKNKEVFTLYKIDDKNFLIGAETGAYSFKSNMCIRFGVYLLDKSIDSPVKSFSQLEMDSTEGYQTKYLIPVGNEIFNTTNGVIAEVESINMPFSNNINSIYCEGDRRYMIATERGLYLTDRRYDLDDMLNRFTILQLKDIAKDAIQPHLERHLQTYHNMDPEHQNQESYFLEMLNKKCPAEEIQIPGSFTSSTKVDLYNSIKKIDNDVVMNVEFNDTHHYVKASVRNWAVFQLDNRAIYSDQGYIDQFSDTANNIAVDMSNIPYIVKWWNSGIKEFYIYVPSTGTYYINNPQGFSGSIYSGATMPRKNVSNAAFQNQNIISQTCTHLRIILNNNHFNLKRIYSIDINNQSLPLKIYKDSTYCQVGRENLFDTAIEPSEINSLPIIDSEGVNNINGFLDEDNNLKLNFSIYGSDAQAIHITAE